MVQSWVTLVYTIVYKYIYAYIYKIKQRCKYLASEFKNEHKFIANPQNSI
jgi:hypothetical protein